MPLKTWMPLPAWRKRRRCRQCSDEFPADFKPTSTLQRPHGPQDFVKWHMPLECLVWTTPHFEHELGLIDLRAAFVCIAFP
mmetsp:Transcript_83117/g.137471  ORF Transcript_83117/g.137471 Transcript_83117/m.137471 type:complete len:81 (+) Transcript_83117:978-1220(+)